MFFIHHIMTTLQSVLFVPHICMDEVQAAVAVFQNYQTSVPAFLHSIKRAFSVCKQQAAKLISLESI